MGFASRADEAFYELLIGVCDTDDKFLDLCTAAKVEGKQWLKLGHPQRVAHLIRYFRNFAGSVDTLRNVCAAKYPEVSWDSSEPERAAWWQSPTTQVLMGVFLCCLVLAMMVWLNIIAEVQARDGLEHFVGRIETSEGTVLQLHVLYPKQVGFQAPGEPSLALHAWLTAPAPLLTQQPYTLTLRADDSIQFYQGEQLVVVPRLALRVGGGESQAATIQVRRGVWREGDDASVSIRGEVEGGTLTPDTIGPVPLLTVGEARWAGVVAFLANPETVVGLIGALVTGVGLYIAITTFLDEQQRREAATRTERQQGLIRAATRQLEGALPAALEELHRLERIARQEKWERSACETLKEVVGGLRDKDIWARQVLGLVSSALKLRLGATTVEIALLKDALALKIFPPRQEPRLRIALQLLEGTFILPPNTHVETIVAELLTLWQEYGQDELVDIVVVSLELLGREFGTTAALDKLSRRWPGAGRVWMDARLATMVGTDNPPPYKQIHPPLAAREGDTPLGRWLASENVLLDPFSGGRVRNDSFFYETMVMSKDHTAWLQEELPCLIQVPSAEDGLATALYLDNLCKLHSPPNAGRFSVMAFPRLIPGEMWNAERWLQVLTQAVGKAWLEFLAYHPDNLTVFWEFEKAERHLLIHLLLWVSHSPVALYLSLGLAPSSENREKKEVYALFHEAHQNAILPETIPSSLLRQWVTLRPKMMPTSFVLVCLETTSLTSEALTEPLVPLVELAEGLLEKKVIAKLFSPLAPNSLNGCWKLEWSEADLREFLDRRVNVASKNRARFEKLFNVAMHDTTDHHARLAGEAGGSLAVLLQRAHQAMMEQVASTPAYHP